MPHLNRRDEYSLRMLVLNEVVKRLLPVVSRLLLFLDTSPKERLRQHTADVEFFP